MGLIEVPLKEMCINLLQLSDIECNASEELDSLKKKVENLDRNAEYYFNCGMAAGKILSESYNEEGCDTLNATIGGLESFLTITGVKQNSKN